MFLLATAREHYERSRDGRVALVEGLARSGRVINAAGAVIVVVFFSFALGGTLHVEEMGVILGVAVLLDTMLVRLLLLPATLRLLGRWACGPRADSIVCFPTSDSATRERRRRPSMRPSKG